MNKIKLPEDMKMLLDRYRVAYEENQRLRKEIGGGGSTVNSDGAKSDEELLKKALISGLTKEEFMVESNRKILREIEESLNETT